MATVKVYSTPTCPYCKMVKSFLTEHSIVFADIDVSVNQAAAQEMIAKSKQMGVPVLEIDGQIVVGFDKPKISQLLNLK
ncbi:MAG: glutathione S-transferase N-terminal domain-containing protein [Candidatus Margulisbacteria bacterium]|nr:glutathione S-transferase N-terminal domain-containing protein [Candidatus Margulisiibacteriota bacterium]MBU1617718.1 glutathione S-transferase N-terminal domain-containing protein [Candidatus Margulisiibacteriota bacterium]MBU1866851.1 glutathione S-transferase N-terminal domain-containing protein [Candidatus Margulisiibacteriota bacterium]